MDFAIETIKIGTTPNNLQPFEKYFSAFKNKNNLASLAQHQRNGAGDLVLNDELLYPEAQFVFFYLTPQQYSTLIKQFNVPYVYLGYHDTEMNRAVQRCMKLQTFAMSDTNAYDSKYKGTLQFTANFTSVFSYKDYTDLEANAIETRIP